MSSKGLSTYLNDHLAGAAGALELLDHLAGLHIDPERKRVFLELRAEVEADRQVLQGLLEKLGGKESTARRAAAWLSEKIGQVKLHLDDPGDGQLRVLEAVEALGLGIQGKLALWRALAAATDRVPQLRGLDLARLEQRALQQHQRVETLRLEAARMALTNQP